MTEYLPANWQELLDAMQMNLSVAMRNLEVYEQASKDCLELPRLRRDGSEPILPGVDALATDWHNKLEAGRREADEIERVFHAQEQRWTAWQQKLHDWPTLVHTPVAQTTIDSPIESAS